MILVDTNVLLYAADASSPFHAPCRDWVEKQRQKAEAWYCAWPIVYEFLRVSTHPSVFRRPWKGAEAWAYVEGLLASPGLDMLVASERHATVAAEVLREMPHLAGSIFHDTHTAVLMKEHGVRRICTRDSNFHRFRFLEVVDPVVVAQV